MISAELNISGTAYPLLSAEISEEVNAGFTFKMEVPGVCPAALKQPFAEFALTVCGVAYAGKVTALDIYEGYFAIEGKDLFSVEAARTYIDAQEIKKTTAAAVLDAVSVSNGSGVGVHFATDEGNQTVFYFVKNFTDMLGCDFRTNPAEYGAEVCIRGAAGLGAVRNLDGKILDYELFKDFTDLYSYVCLCKVCPMDVKKEHHPRLRADLVQQDGAYIPASLIPSLPTQLLSLNALIDVFGHTDSVILTEIKEEDLPQFGAAEENREEYLGRVEPKLYVSIDILDEPFSAWGTAALWNNQSVSYNLNWSSSDPVNYAPVSWPFRNSYVSPIMKIIDYQTSPGVKFVCWGAHFFAVSDVNLLFSLANGLYNYPDPSADSFKLLDWQRNGGAVYTTDDGTFKTFKKWGAGVYSPHIVNLDAEDFPWIHLSRTVSMDYLRDNDPAAHSEGWGKTAGTVYRDIYTYSDSRLNENFDPLAQIESGYFEQPTTGHWLPSKYSCNAVLENTVGASNVMDVLDEKDSWRTARMVVRKGRSRESKYFDIYQFSELTSADIFTDGEYADEYGVSAQVLGITLWTAAL